MPRPNAMSAMYEEEGASMAQRLTLAAGCLLSLGIALWLLLNNGIPAVSHWLARNWEPGDFQRRVLLACALSIYVARVLFTDFKFMKRGISWKEAATIIPWIFFLFVLIAVAGGRNQSPLAFFAWLGVFLFLLGSWLNSAAEYQRDAWKQHPENRGKLYTLGLFRHVRHPNYLGDLLSFSGLSLIAGAWITWIIPLLMLAGFVVANIPALDAHLRKRYGAAFDEYSKRTWKLIPFLY